MPSWTSTTRKHGAEFGHISVVRISAAGAGIERRSARRSDPRSAPSRRASSADSTGARATSARTIGAGPSGPFSFPTMASGIFEGKREVVTLTAYDRREMADYLRDNGYPEHVVNAGRAGLIDRWRKFVEEVEHGYRFGPGRLSERPGFARNPRHARLWMPRSRTWTGASKPCSRTAINGSGKSLGRRPLLGLRISQERWARAP